MKNYSLYKKITLLMLLCMSVIMSCKKADNPTTYSIGQNYGGGIIFYLDGTGKHGLIAAPSDQSAVLWGAGTIITNATGTAVGTGQANTTSIINAQGVGSYAASICDQLVINGYSDWYLPSKDELSYLYNQKSLVGGFGLGAKIIYWSSTETAMNAAWIENFNDGTQASYGKFTAYSTRAIRSF
jgi:hypothetical protein